MELVPDGDALLVEARISPREIDQIRLGQKMPGPFLRLQPAHHAGVSWRADLCLGRHGAGPSGPIRPFTA